MTSESSRLRAARSRGPIGPGDLASCRVGQLATGEVSEHVKHEQGGNRRELLSRLRLG
jgi:hypothetical protein